MEPLVQKLLVVGGNGFVGSAVCKAALARGFQVTSISSSGRPYTTPRGHSPAWTSKVNWLKADAFQPDTYAHLLPETTAVVHTMGTLLENPRYKAALKDGNVPALLGSLLADITSGSGNPLEDHQKEGGYEKLNYKSAIRVCEAFVSSKSEVDLPSPRAFLYMSAEDIYRPFISAKYIETKRRAELDIGSIVSANPKVRSVYVRPGLIYHPHFRPLTSPLAVLLEATASLQAKAPIGLPTPTRVLRALARTTGPLSSSLVPPSPLASVANALSTPPIHVDHVGQAIAIAADNTREDVRGVVDVREMRRLNGWTDADDVARPDEAAAVGQ